MILPVSADVRRVEIMRVREGRADQTSDDVAVEAPLEIRLNGASFAVIMRSPGRALELAAGFLFAERVLKQPDDLGAIAHCTDGSHAENVVDVTLTGSSATALAETLASARRVVMNASCGVCGRQSIEALAADCAPLPPGRPLPDDVIAALPARLRERQAAFDQTGGLHAAGLYTGDGHLVDVAEDIGRHNAVDKVIGRLILRDELPARALGLIVSGRTSFEIVQKAWLAGIGCIASVSAPSSLAIDLAEAAGIRLIGFVRDEAFNVYAPGASG
jgi:FdhD protein